MRQALGSDTVEIIGWDCQQIHGTGGVAAGTDWSRIYRLAGTGQDRDAIVPWWLILKPVRSIPIGNRTPSSTVLLDAEALEPLKVIYTEGIDPDSEFVAGEDKVILWDLETHGIAGITTPTGIFNGSRRPGTLGH